MPSQLPLKTRRLQYSHDLRILCVPKLRSGLGYASIGKILNISKSSVRNIVIRYKKHGHSVLTPRPGRKRITEVRIDRCITRAGEANRFISEISLIAEVGMEGDQYHEVRSAVGSVVVSLILAFMAAQLHRQERLAYAKKYQGMTADDYEQVMFTDEAIVEMHGTTGRRMRISHPIKELPRLWSGIHDRIIKRSVRSMPQRLDAVGKARGSHTNY
ncbi:LOW QUALITY PROTEIN: Transposase [Phytophthora palmivora]|uniref:Transposase n=1 Tax=Phytophthora palmivora TaxID=4796 RepID=A0A2P4XM97_9STRA|nr:LOW QUALITY PROTEIN: Transposase [Phytophthora palmivora]